MEFYPKQYLRNMRNFGIRHWEHSISREKRKSSNTIHNLQNCYLCTRSHLHGNRLSNHM